VVVKTGYSIALFLSLVISTIVLSLYLYGGYREYSKTHISYGSTGPPSANQYSPILRYSNGTGAPELTDRHLKVEVVAQDLELPTTMAFLGPNDILVLEKQKGTVQRIVDGKVLSEPLLDVNVAGEIERCMCGIVISHAKGPNNGTITYVFLYYTEASGKDGANPIGNRLYRYQLVDNKLVNPKLFLDLPATPGPRHNGGAIVIGPDNNVYVPIGDVDGHKTQAENVKRGPPPDGTGGILRITQDGQIVPNGPLGNTSPLNLYYAYGIRNSFGIGFDPLTGNLWDTENGPSFGDEINLVQPGFNSGWNEVQGIWTGVGGKLVTAAIQPEGLVDFGGKGKYHSPQFVWNHTVGVTGIIFLNSDKLGKKYENDIFVGDVHRGNLYHFKLNKDRTGLTLEEPITTNGNVAYSVGDLQPVIFGTGFGGITDLAVSPYDGYLYIVSIGQGKIYRIVPAIITDK
jgi:glucose/arabinose dehydrogenase